MRLHPFLFGLFPVFTLYARNILEISWQGAAVALFSAAAVVWVLAVLANFIFKDKDKSAFFVSVIIILFSVIGRAIYASHSFLSRAGIEIQVRYLAFFLVALAVVLVFVVVRMKWRFSVAARVMTAAGAFLFIFPFTHIAKTLPENYAMIRAARAWVAEEEIIKPPLPPQEKPDIYYILLDAHAHPETLFKSFGYDESGFVSFLKKKGFFVPARSRANYPYTIPALPSILNMEYMHERNVSFNDSKNVALLHELVTANRVFSFLKKQGYEVVTMSHTSNSPEARARDADLKLVAVPFNLMFLKDNALEAIGSSNPLLHPIQERFLTPFLEGERKNRMFDMLEEIVKRNEKQNRKPLFVFAHIMSPHPPNTYGADCGITSDAVKRGDEAYVWEVRCLDQKVEKFVEKILSQAQTPPIIIIQSDHGQDAAQSSVETGDDSNEIRRGIIIQERLRNFSAIYAPGSERDFYDDLTPVNTFRLIFNNYFGTSLERLPDKSYFMNEPGYGGVDVTEEITW